MDGHSSTIEDVPSGRIVETLTPELCVLRDPVFGDEIRSDRARQVAAQLQRTQFARKTRLLSRLRDNASRLRLLHRRMKAEWNRRTQPGGLPEWVLDNYHIIEENVQEVITGLPPGFYRELPHVKTKAGVELPRVYLLAVDLIASSDGVLDRPSIRDYVQAFQEVAPLTSGELWALPTMMRMGLLENLRRLSDRYFLAQREYARARMMIQEKVQARSIDVLEAEVHAAVRNQGRLATAFLAGAVDAAYLLEDEGGRDIDVVASLLSRLDLHPSEVLREAQAMTAADRVSTGNSITSLRVLGIIEWREFFEETSLLEAALHHDPAGIYRIQDAKTRDRCRHAVERLAKNTEMAECEVARIVIERAEACEGSARHIGYHLLGAGRRDFERDVKFRSPFSQSLLEGVREFRVPIYLFTVAAVWLSLLFAVSWFAGIEISLIGATMAALLAVPLSEMAVGIVHHFALRLIPPRVIPKLDTRRGLPKGCTTAVVIPTLLVNESACDELVHKLERHYLSNSGPDFWYALLSDFPDAQARELESDVALLQRTAERIHHLNARYGLLQSPRFFLFHRPRQWNQTQQCWIAWERKRGKLLEFCRWLRGDTKTSFDFISPGSHRLPATKYVLTLDSDTLLPPDTARRLVGAAAHPLNQPVLSSDARRVTAGYTFFQPRVDVSMSAARRTPFTRLYAQSTGIDPYSVAASDVYQDLFDAGSFVGKGLFDVDLFLQVLDKSFLDETILSHDLIEGNFARCALVSDIQFMDEFPAQAHSYLRREHRWIRGDWQILPYLLGTLPNGLSNPLPALERWKVFDNLRRSLLAPSLVALLLIGWFLTAGSPWIWTSAGLLVVFLHVLLALSGQLSILWRGRGALAAWRNLSPAILPTLGHAAVEMCLLIEQARTSVDAIARTLTRLFWTRRRLLEWETAAATDRRFKGTLREHWQAFWLSPAAATAIVVLLAVYRPEALLAAAVFLIAWLATPWVTYLLGQQRKTPTTPLSRRDVADLRRWARKIWDFFESTVGKDTHHLPPDNVQEIPELKVAPRTSPTNIGLYMASQLAAHDLGYLSSLRMVERLECTSQTIQALPRWNGHLLNWYATDDLRPLQPEYISTVDSGNFFASLLTVCQGLDEMLSAPPSFRNVRAGLRDTYQLASVEVRELTIHAFSRSSDFAGRLKRHFERLGQVLDQKPKNSLEFCDWLSRARGECDMLTTILGESTTTGGFSAPAGKWITQLSRDVSQHEASLKHFEPWLPLLHEIPPSLSTVSSGKPSALSKTWQGMYEEFLEPISLTSLMERLPKWRRQLRELRSAHPSTTKDDNSSAWLDRAEESLGCRTVEDFVTRVRRLEHALRQLALGMDFRPLYNAERRLFAIGYSQTSEQLDRAYYDLLASEAALTSFVSIAFGEAPREHWFQLSRPVTGRYSEPALISWGGTMFEYLMPRIFLKPPSGTLLAQAQEAAVRHQVRYGKQAGVPWGISESAYAALNAGLDYQYQAFGVPTLGLKRGLTHDLVVAPYATLLALSVAPQESLANLRALSSLGAEGVWGFYEAVDFSTDRSDDGTGQMVRTYMAHHQGMSLLSIANTLFDDVIARRLYREPAVRSAELLLEERIPFDAPRQIIHHATDETPEEAAVQEGDLPVVRRLATPHTSFPRSHLLSNGEYSVSVSQSGSTRSTWNDLDVLHWHPDRVRDDCGMFVYLRNKGGRTWCPTYQPLRTEGDSYEVTFSSDKVEIKQSDAQFDTRLEIVVSPEDSAEFRVVRVINRSNKAQTIEWTSFAPVVLARHADDRAHPAFQKLFLQTEWISNGTLLCHRRPRSARDETVWAFHSLCWEGEGIGGIEFETDRRRFLGRGRDASHPIALESREPLSGFAGPALDPVLSLRRRLKIAPGERGTVYFVLGVGVTREEALLLADKYRTPGAIARAMEMALARSADDRSRLRISPYQEQLYQRLSAQLVYPGRAFRADSLVIASNRLPYTELGRHGVSGDNPLVLVRVGSEEHLAFARDMVLAHAFWRSRGLRVDLLFLDEHGSGYFEDVQRQLRDLVRSAFELDLLDRPGGIHVRNATHLTADDMSLLRTAACCEFDASMGSLSEQVNRTESRVRSLQAPKLAVDRMHSEAAHAANGEATELSFGNSHGGMSADGREYHLFINAEGASHRRTPLPWSNVVANPDFGFLVTESGGGFTWSRNSQTNRLTPWSNDPVTDPAGEVLYLCDVERQEFWSATPAAAASGISFHVRHAQGYSAFQHERAGLACELILFCDSVEPVKFFHLRLANRTKETRRLSATLYVEWVLGSNRERDAHYVVTGVDETSDVVWASNRAHPDYPERVAFLHASLPLKSFTCDREEFLGRHGDLHRPLGMTQAMLTNSAGGGFDPCGAIRVDLAIGPEQTQEVTFVLGQSDSLESALCLANRFGNDKTARESFVQAVANWEGVLSTITVRTPQPTFDAMVNRWLMYQTFACRFWGRSGFYQSGGAYGFRDQLQDSLALLHAAPRETRNHILLCASRQFEEGDVQHWWHPPKGAGVRTHISDDFLWLAYVTSRYIQSTGDQSILNEVVPFLHAPTLQVGQDDDYRIPDVSHQSATLYEHCLRAIRNGCRFGAHGLPLMGGGDWNDGMNRVGTKGQGESVFNGWFLLVNLRQFARIAEGRGDMTTAQEFDTIAHQLRASVETSAWDGDWYLRAFYDDGTPLGTAAASECRIDALVQSWSVLSGEADSRRARKAMSAVREHLVDNESRLIRLLTPPFHDLASGSDPGYIKGYLPGIRENGGQYTHAAAWVIQAMAELGDGDEALRLFQLINPLDRSTTDAGVEGYMAEPYVVAGDVYSQPPHAGRAGWSWYTGSCGWLYQAAVSSILGVHRRGNTLRFAPCVPRSWTQYSVRYRYGGTIYHIEFRPAQKDAIAHVELDDERCNAMTIPLSDDGKFHRVEVYWQVEEEPARVTVASR